MQTFLPYSDITESMRVLDNKRLGKQRVETYQIISAITGRLKLDGTPYKGWVNHPCSVMWRNHVPLLKMYLNTSIDEWVKRGFKNTMDREDIDEPVTYPDWWGNKKFHDSHKSNLLKKDFDFYSQYRWSVDPTNPYVWKDKEGKWYEQHSGTKGRVYFVSNIKSVSL
jgi:hypothetical protein